MIHVILVFVVFFVLLLVLSLSVLIGRYFGRRQVKKHVEHKLEVVGVAESAVFGLLALLVAFTFSGAYDRFANRNLHILEVANVYSVAYEYTDLVPAKYQPILRDDIRQYVDLNLAAYHDIPYMSKVDNDLDKARVLQHRIWSTAVAATQGNTTLAQLVMPAMSNMFDVSRTGINMTKIHPPTIIFVLLVGLAALGAFLVGYNSAENRQKLPIHVLSYVVLTAFTIYIIINIEFPRTGFMRYSSLDQVVIDVRNDMNTTGHITR